jgi:hypothetical protein
VSRKGGAEWLAGRLSRITLSPGRVRVLTYAHSMLRPGHAPASRSASKLASARKSWLAGRLLLATRPIAAEAGYPADYFVIVLGPHPHVCHPARAIWRLVRPSKAIWSWVPRLWPMYAAARTPPSVTSFRLVCRCRPPVDGGHPALFPSNHLAQEGTTRAGGGNLHQNSPRPEDPGWKRDSSFS